MSIPFSIFMLASCTTSSIIGSRYQALTDLASAPHHQGTTVGGVNGKAKLENTVVFGPARFTVLSSTLIRMELGGVAPRGKRVFDDRASLIFQNRDTPPVPFRVARNSDETSVTISTSRVNLTFSGCNATEDPCAFTADNLHAEFVLSPATTGSWRFGMSDEGANLLGTVVSQDCYHAPFDCASHSQHLSLFTFWY